MDLELRLARLQSELDALGVRQEDARVRTDARVLALEESVAAQASALLVLTRAAAKLPLEAQQAVPEALTLWAEEMRNRGEERGALAAEALRDALLPTLLASVQARFGVAATEP